MSRYPLLALVLAVSAAPTLALQRVRRDAAEQVEAYLESCEAFGWSGSVLVARGSKVLYEGGFGLADREAGRANEVDTLFEIASTTKPFTACAILALVEDGSLELEDSIAEHLPGVPEDKAGITIEHLLAHTSGMPRAAAGGRGSDLEAAVHGYLSAAKGRQPGAGHEYWNGGYALLAGIVEQVSGQSYTDFCRERIFGPAGMQNTCFTGDEPASTDLQSVGYDGVDRVRRAAEHAYGTYGWQYRGMGGIVTSAADLLRFVLALEDGKILGKKTVETMQEPVMQRYALGWSVDETRRGTQRIGHGGDVRGFHTQLQRFPKEKVTVILLGNVDGIPMHKLAWNIEALLFGERQPYPVPPQTLEYSDRELDAMAGSYFLNDDERLIVERAGVGISVTAVGPTACAALSGSPASAGLDAQIERARALLEAVRDGDEATVAEALAERIPKSWPGTLVTDIWPAHLERWGECEAVTALGARSLPDGGVEVLLGLQHAQGSARLKVVLREGRLSIFNLNGPRALVSRSFGLDMKGVFQEYDWGRDQTTPAPFLMRGKKRKVSVFEIVTEAGETLSFEKRD